MKALVIIALVGVAGCATVGETMQTKPPSGVYQTSKTPIEYRDCIVLSQELPGVLVTDQGDGFMFLAPRVAGQVFTVKPTGSGSEVTVWGMLGTRRVARQCI